LLKPPISCWKKPSNPLVVYCSESRIEIPFPNDEINAQGEIDK